MNTAMHPHTQTIIDFYRLSSIFIPLWREQGEVEISLHRHAELVSASPLNKGIAGHTRNDEAALEVPITVNNKTQNG
jgi:hypothetical protein